jgi:hypothetical protein
VLEVDGSQSMANPFVEVCENARRVRQAEIFFPPAQIFAEPLAHFFDASPT